MLTIAGADLCTYAGTNNLSDCAPVADVILRMRGSVETLDSCVEGVAGPVANADGDPLCMPVEGIVDLGQQSPCP